MINKEGTEWWDRQFNLYDFKKNPFRVDRAGKVEYQTVFSKFNITPIQNPRLVELGCGDGRFVLNFAKKGYLVTGIDVSKNAVDVLKKRASNCKLSAKIKAVNNDLFNPIKELAESFDAGYMISTYHCISNNEEYQKRVVRNFVKLIKKRGRFLIMEPNPLNLLYYFAYPSIYKDNWREGFNITHSTKGKLVRLLNEVGMSDIKVFHHSFLPTSFINKWSFIKVLNQFLCTIPGIRNFSAFHIITAVKN
jgi:SAM-dependent methyltransferase